MSFIVAAKVVASRPPKRQPTGTPTACAQNLNSAYILRVHFKSKLLSIHFNSPWHFLDWHAVISLAPQPLQPSLQRDEDGPGVVHHCGRYGVFKTLL